MPSPATLRLAGLAAALSVSLAAQAESIASSASSAGSASSGSVSDSLRGSSNSSRADEKKAEGDYRIIDVAQVPDRAGYARITLQGATPEQRLVLDLPQSVMAREGLGQGDLVHARNRVYGLEFARGDNRQAFYLVLADDWHDELAARPVRL